MSSSNKRIRGIAVSRPLLIGTTATPLSAADKIVAPPDHTHKWTVAVRSAASYPLPPVAQVSASISEETAGISTRGRETEADYHKMVGGRDDISYFIKKVQFKLHETYSQPTRNVEKPPFQVTETGWGEFEIQIKIFFVPEANEKPVTYFHHLKLHPWLPPIFSGGDHAPAPAPAPTQPSEPLPTAPAAPAEQEQTSETTSVAVAPPASGGLEASGVEAADGAHVKESDSKDPIQAPKPSEDPPVEDGTKADATMVDADHPDASAPAAPPVAAQPQVRMPPVVHSWQYEEVVFPEPTEAFYEVLIRQPPTPLPSLSAQAFTDPASYQRYQARREGKPDARDGPSLPPHPVHNPAGHLFDALSQEAILGEAKRLDDARITIVNEIEKGRMQLIQKERELRELRKKLE